MMSYRNIKYIFLQLVFIGMMLIFIIACQPRLTKDVLVDNPDSILLGMLIQTTDFSSDWQWLYSDIRQKEELPIDENRGVLEEASHSLTGLYGDPAHYIVIFHILEKYKQTTEEEAASDFTNETVPNFASEIGFTLILDNDDINAVAECVRETSSRQPASIFCKTNVDYNDLVSILTIYAPADVEDETLKKILTQALYIIDERVKEMQ